MHHPAPFLASIRDRPADDGPRLVYADWLEEKGDADRAEFIRVQVDLAALGERPMRCILGRTRRGRFCRFKSCRRCRRQTLLGRERALLLSHRPHWQPGWTIGWACLNEMGATGAVSVFRFRRGFVEEIGLPWESWLFLANFIRGDEPVTRVGLTTFPSAEFSNFRQRWPGIQFDVPTELRRGQLITLPPGMRLVSGPVCERCRGPGVYWTEERLAATDLSGRDRSVEGPRRAWCEPHAPAGAVPIRLQVPGLAIVWDEPA